MYLILTQNTSNSIRHTLPNVKHIASSNEAGMMFGHSLHNTPCVAVLWCKVTDFKGY